MSIYKNFLKGPLTLKVDASGLAVFRMLFSIMVFCEAWQFFVMRHVIFDRLPYEVPGELKYYLFFTFWVISLALLFFGLFTRMATVLCYIFAVMAFSSAEAFEYHVFYTYVGVSFFMMFMPVSRVWSLDSAIARAKFGQAQSGSEVLEINYLIPVFVGIALIYFDSVFLKAASPMWLNGLGIWLPSSIPPVVWNDTSWLLNCKPVVVGLSYFVMVFEALFILLMWLRKLRPWLAVIGIFFHLGIHISYPIPYFAFTYIVIYLLLLPPGMWRRIFGKLKVVFSSAFFLRMKTKAVSTLVWFDIMARGRYSVESETDSPIQSTKSRNRLTATQTFWKITVPVLLVMQLGVIYFSHHEHSSLGKMTRLPRVMALKFLGVYRHSVFLDYHFEGFNHIVKVTFIDDDKKEHLVPLIDHRGMTSTYNKGMIWKNVSFNVVTPQLRPERLGPGLETYARFYLDENASAQKGQFKIYVKEFETPREWEKDFLTRQLAKPWFEAGNLKIDDDDSQIEWTPYMVAIFASENP